MKHKLLLFILIVVLFIFILASCLGPGIITEIGDEGPGPGPTPTPVSTPTSWYIQNVFAGDWSYQFFSGDEAVQTYKVTHQVFNNGQIHLKFIDLKSGFTYFNADGVIDMNTGDFFAQGELAKVGDIDGNIEFYGQFATDTISEYSADQEDFFSGEDKTMYKYTITTIRYHQ